MNLKMISRYNSVLLFFVVLFLACQNLNAQSSQSIQQVSAETFSQYIDNTKNVQLLDVRTLEEYNEGHIPNSTLADFNDTKAFNAIVGKLDKTKPVAIYCLMGGRSSEAATLLSSKGFKGQSLKGGIIAWKKANKPTTVPTKIKQTPVASTVIEKHSDAPLNIAGLEAIIKTNKSLLIDLGAKWCGPCKKLNPILAQFEKKHPEIKVLRIDVDDSPEVAAYLNASEIPLLLKYVDGKKVMTSVGFMPLENLEKMMK